ncbi:MAG: tRNA (adenosine(37)-N6)-dimethylallyltransferase MiaA [Clostridia bacterium]|nr:tRNA (adenosine(37)-N6)-dimethylallyltransferase MiaA [Clostridia bacterium]
MKIPVIVICGPTASGKTDLAIAAAKHFGGEVISADSMQVYKEMDIGTAKPAKEEMQGIAHHMIDVADITQNYSVSDYCSGAHTAAAEIVQRGHIPIIAGGTGLYIDSLVNDLDFSKSTSCDEVRLRLLEYAEKKGSEALHRRLASLDPAAAAAIHHNNVKRVMRALEHIEITGEKFSEYKLRAAGRESRYHPLWLFIDVERQLLYERINKRVDIMMEKGLLDEAKKIYNKHLPRSLTALGGIGYKELFDCFDGLCSQSAAVDAIKQNSRRYAKRQLTWFRRNTALNRIPFGNGMTEAAFKIIDGRKKEYEQIQL